MVQKIENTYLKVSEDNVDLKGRVITVDTISEMLVPQEDDSQITNELLKKLNSVMLAREKEVEDKFNCQIEWRVMKQSDLQQLYNKIKNGQYDGDIVFLDPQNSAVVGMLNENLLEPLDEYIDFESGVYSEDQEMTSWKGKHYGINIYFIGNQFGNFLLYNKTMLKNEGLPDPYELMKTGQWIWDEFLDIARSTTKDTNGDNVIDCWGIDGNYFTLYNSFLYSNDGDYIKDDGNQFKLVLDSDESIEALNFVTELYKTNNVVYDTTLDSTKSDTSEESSSQERNRRQPLSLFYQGKAAFTTTNRYYRNEDMGFEIGAVCYPKGPKASDYISYQTAGYFYAIPTGVEDVKSVAVVMANLFSYFDNTKDKYLTYDDLGVDEILSDDLRDILRHNIKYSWFISNNNYLSELSTVYRNILVNNMSAEEAINSEKAEINNMLDLFNQSAAQ